MAKATKSKKAQPTKGTVTRLAKLRRDGATWGQLDAEIGQPTRSSTAWRELFESYGFDKYGRSNPNQATKAKGWGSAELNGKSKKAPAKAKKAKKKVVRRKATAKK